MNYLSVCSGIEAATVAWEPLGWDPVAFAEVDKFPSAVLAHHWPTVPNLGDMTKIKGGDYRGLVDLLVGGTPCQSFSIAGLRNGLDDPRGDLTMQFFRLAYQLRSRWLVWENVPGLLSHDGGRTFGAVLRALGECGYGFAYRVLDAQYFGIPQRRRRVYVVGHLGDWRRAAAVLFERHCLSGDTPPGRETRQDVAGTLAASSFCGGGMGGRPEGAAGNHFVAHTLLGHHNGRMSADQTFVAHTLRGEGFDASEDGTGRQNLVVQKGVRRLTPLECERLQGFPDGYTKIPWRGKPAGECPDGPRYKALGNSMAVPVMRWIGERIQLVDGMG